MRDIIDNLLNSWCKGKIDTTLLSENFLYRGFHSGFSTIDWLEWHEESLSENDAVVKILDINICGSKASMLFEVLDDITGLEYVYSWFIEVDDRKIVKLLESKCEVVDLNQ